MGESREAAERSTARTGVRGFWAGIWLSRTRSLVAAGLLSSAIASVLYGFNWHTFYDTQRNFAMRDAVLIAADIEDLARQTGAAPGHDAGFREALGSYLERRRARVTVIRGSGDAPGWRQSNQAVVDEKRTPFDESFDLAGADLRVEVREGIRPSFLTALGRAWSFSLADYQADPKRWHDDALYNRSMPLYGYLFTIVVVGFGTIRALHRDQLQLQSLNEDASRITLEFDELQEQSTREIINIRTKVGRTEHERDEAMQERERLVSEITAVEQEYGDLEGGKSSVSDAHLQSIRDRKAHIERELATHDARVSGLETNLHEVRNELSAAEELLGEVESKRDDLTGKLRERNRRIRRLQELVEQAQRDAHSMQLESVRISQGEEGDSVASALESQLVQWFETNGEAKVNFSKHSRTGPVEDLFEKLDRRFIDRFFTHVVNPEYERGARKTIRVSIGEERGGDTGHSGELVIALDDDAGRTLGLRFEVKKGAPSVGSLGFVLALLCRETCRPLRNYAIKSR